MPEHVKHAGQVKVDAPSKVMSIMFVSDVNKMEERVSSERRLAL
jgi:hypothetical protein